MNIKMNCETCSKRYGVEEWKYSKKGVQKRLLDGFICMAYADQGSAVLRHDCKVSGMCKYWAGRPGEMHFEQEEK